MAVPVAVTNLTFKVVDENVLVYDARADMIHVLNRSAGRVLQLADGTRDVESIVELYSRENSIDAGSAGADVNAILAEFLRLGLVSNSVTVVE